MNECSRARARRRRAARIALALAAISLSGCERAAESPSPPSIVLVSLDTLRPDHLGAYGYPRPTSPTLDAFQAASVCFTEARCQSPGTLTSHLSLLTSLSPRHFRITRADGRNEDMFSTQLRLPDEALTLAEFLRDRGYETAAFTGGGFVGAHWGFDQGFELYDENRTRFEGLRVTLPRLRAFLEGRDDPERPLFLFVHTYDVHEPYWVRGPLGKLFSRESFPELALRVEYRPVPSVLNERIDALEVGVAQEVENLYDNGIRDTDGLVAELFRLLEASGTFEDAIVVVLSDHGEEFREHGRFNHGPTLYEELLRVPLMIRLPGGRSAGRLVTAPVALFDVAPTLTELAGFVPPDSFQGWSLASLLAGEGDRERFVRRPLLLDVPSKQHGVHGMLVHPLKLIARDTLGDARLFELDRDPSEARALDAREHAATYERLGEELARLEREAEALGDARGWSAVLPADSAEAALPAEVRDQLESLGYAD